MRQRRRLTTAVAVALSGVLSSGLTAAYLRATAPDTLALRGDLLLTPEQRHLAALLAEPAAPFAAAGAGRAVDATALGADGLASLGFRRGWTRTWQAPSGERLDAFVLEFADARGAAAYGGNAGRAARLLARPVPFAVAGLPAATGLADRVADADGRYLQLVALHRGPWAALLVLATAEREPGATIVGLAQRQWARLAAT